MREWKIGDPVDGTTDGWMDAQNWGHGESDEPEENNGKIDNSQKDIYAKKAWDLYMDFKEEEALRYINMALEMDENDANNLNRKAIILEALERYSQSEEYYNRSLKLSPKKIVYENKARMLYDWASKLLEDSKELSDGLDKLNDAKEKVKKAIQTIPGEDSEEDVSKYLNLWDSVNFYISYERTFQRNIENMKKYPKDELFTIAGRDFCKSKPPLNYGVQLRLVREPENEFDRDAIAVYVGAEKVGYVANSTHTRYEMTSTASELKGKIMDNTQAEYLCYLQRYADVQFHIARIVR